MKVIELNKISKVYHLGKLDVPVLHDVSFEILEGEFVSIMGHSGSGKSTLLNLLGLLDKPTGGTYNLASKEVSTLSDDELAAIRNRFIGFVFQNFNLLTRMSAKENVSLPLVYSDIKKKLLDEVALLKRVGLADRINHKPNELSGGEQQRVAIARSLINSPVLVLADEPTGNLDTKSAEEIIKILKELNDSGITIVMVTHEPDLAQAASRIITMQDGRIISDKYINGKKEVNVPGIVKPDKTKQEVPKHGFSILRLKSYFVQALRSLVSNKTRSMLSILGVLIGVASVIAMLALGTGAQADVKERISALGSNLLTVRPGSRRSGGVSLEAGAVTRLAVSDAGAIKDQISGIDKIASYVSGRGQVVYGGKNWNTSIVGTTADYPDIKNARPTSGRFFTEKETITRAKVAIIGQTIVKEIFGEQNPIGEFIKIKRIDFQVIGILPAKGATGWRDSDDTIVIPLNTAMYRLLGKEYVDYIDVQVSSAELMDDVSDKIKKLITTLHRMPASATGAVEIRNMADIQETVTATIKTFAYLLGSIAFISLLVGGIGIMNIMLVTVTERTKEIGLRKALGANNKDILFQFIIESIVVCILGGTIGIMLGSVISLSLATFAGWSTKISLSSVLLAFIFSVLIGLIFGLWPARKASRLNPIDALRYE